MERNLVEYVTFVKNSVQLKKDYSSVGAWWFEKKSQGSQRDTNRSTKESHKEPKSKEAKREQKCTI